jgi:hypothetical protein
MAESSSYIPLTVEALAADCMDVRDLYKAGALEGGWGYVSYGRDQVARYFW